MASQADWATEERWESRTWEHQCSQPVMVEVVVPPKRNDRFKGGSGQTEGSCLAFCHSSVVRETALCLRAPCSRSERLMNSILLPLFCCPVLCTSCSFQLARAPRVLSLSLRSQFAREQLARASAGPTGGRPADRPTDEVPTKLPL